MKQLAVIILLFFGQAVFAQVDSTDSGVVVDTLNVGIEEIVTVVNERDSLEKELAAQRAKADSLEQAEIKAKEEKDAPPASVGEAVEDVQENVGETVENIKEVISPAKIISILFVLFFTWLMVKGTNWLFDKAVERFYDRRLQILKVKPIVSILIWILAIFALVKAVFDPDAQTVWALAGSSALALGFALQDVLKNIFGGLMILLDRPFQVGDRVNVKDSYGEVVDIGIRTTTINTLDDSLVTVPNSTIISENVSNANSGALDCMVVVDLYLPIDVNVETVRKLATEAAITSRYLNIDKPVSILFADHFDNQPTCHVKVKAYVLDALYEKPFASDVTEAAKKAFAQNGLYNK